MKLTMAHWTSNPSSHTTPQSLHVILSFVCRCRTITTVLLIRSITNSPSPSPVAHSVTTATITHALTLLPLVPPSLSVVAHMLSPILSPQCQSHLLTANIHPSHLSPQSQFHPKSIVNLIRSVCGMHVLTQSRGPIGHGPQPPTPTPVLGMFRLRILDLP